MNSQCDWSVIQFSLPKCQQFVPLQCIYTAWTLNLTVIRLNELSLSMIRCWIYSTNEWTFPQTAKLRVGMKATSSTESQSNKIFFSSSRFNSSFFIPFFFNDSLFALAVTELSFLFMASQLSECGRIQSIMETTLFYEPQKKGGREEIKHVWIEYSLGESLCAQWWRTTRHSSFYKFVIRFGDRKPGVVWVDWTCRLHRYLENRLWWVENFNNAVIPPESWAQRWLWTFSALNRVIQSIQHNHDESQLLWSRLTLPAFTMQSHTKTQFATTRTENRRRMNGRRSILCKQCVNLTFFFNFSLFSASSSGLRIRFGYVKCLARYRRCTSHMLLRRGWYESP